MSTSPGIAVISFDFSSALTCPMTSLVRFEWALTMHGIFPSFVSARLRSLPSMDMTSPATSETDSSHLTSAALKRFGSSFPRTRLNVSWLGIPFRSGRNFFRNLSFSLPKRSKSVGPLAPATIAHTAIISIS